MKESLLILVLLLLSTLGIRAQSNTVSIGGEASGSGGTSSFTSGQVFYEYKTNTTISVTEGVQQGLITGTTTASSATACDSYTWAANGTTYTTSGSYTNTTTNTAGSTNVETLTLTINNITTTTSSATACDNYYWSANGETYTTSGSYTNTTTNTAGCPANQVLNLTVTPSFTNTTNTSAVGTYTWENNGQTYTSSGVYNGTTVNCVTQVLNLTITPFTWMDII